MVALTAIVALSLVAALVWFAQDSSPRLPDVPGATTSSGAAPAAGSAIDTRGVAEIERVAVPSDGPPSRPAFVEVRVLDEDTSAAVAGASVLFVEPGFAFDKLTPQQRELYSRASESFLRDFGVIQTTDANGATRIPVAAAGRVVVARKGDLYGTNRQRGDGAVQEIFVSRRHTLVVETADEFGNPLPRVKVIGQKSPSSTPPALSLAMLHPTPLQWTLGTTDDNGILTHVLESAADSAHDRIWLHAELVGGASGRQEVDLRAPPPFVRLTLPATGTVRVRLAAADGSAPAREILESLHAELSIAGEPRSARYAKLDAAGGAAFDYVALGQSLRLRFPGMVLARRVFDGPTEGERDVDIVQALDPDHPFLVGTLLDDNGDPIADRRFSIFCRSQGELLASIGADTDSRGRFRAYISDRCLGTTSVEITAGMDMTGVRFAREARLTVAGPLHGRIDLGEIPMPGRD